MDLPFKGQNQPFRVQASGKGSMFHTISLPLPPLLGAVGRAQQSHCPAPVLLASSEGPLGDSAEFLREVTARRRCKAPFLSKL